MDTERTANINIGGEEFTLLLTTRATKEIAARYGGLENLGDKLSRVSAQRLTALLRQVSKRSPPNRTYTSLRIRLSRNQSNFPACNRSWQDTHNAIVFLLRPIMARSHAALPFKFLSFLT